MIGWLRRLTNAARHTRVLLTSFRRATDRARLARLIAVLRQAPGWFEAGGLPVLTGRLEPDGQLAVEPATLERALDQADALAAFSLASPFRACLRRAALRYYILRAHGKAAVFVIGVRRGRQTLSLDGHAWVEVAGQAVREEAVLIESMVEMYRRPA